MPSYTFGKPYYNVATEGNTLATEEAYNVYFEAMPGGGYAIRRRPGLTLLDNPSESTGKGIYWSDRTYKVYLVLDNTLYYLPAPNAAPIVIGYLDGAAATATFAEAQTLDLTDIIYVADGGTLKYVNTTTEALTIPTGFPPQSTFVAMMNNRIIGNDPYKQQNFNFTDFNLASEFDPTYWGAASFGQCVAKPDALRGVYTGWNEIYLWGTQACEVWQDDGVNPLSPLIGSIIEAGIAAPHSVVVANNTLIGLATVQGKRAVVTMQGRTPQVISEPIANILQSYSNVNDAVGQLVFVGGLNMYVLSLPSADATWAYDFKTETWCQWSSWDLNHARHKAFIGRHGTYAKGWNKHLTLGQNGNLYEFDRSVFSDAGDPMKSTIRTGWLDHGSWDRKVCDQLIIKMRGYLSEPAKLWFRWRTDGFPEWSTAIELDIQANGQNDHFCKLNRMGTFRSRQYEFILTDACDLALIGMEIDVRKRRN